MRAHVRVEEAAAAARQPLREPRSLPKIDQYVASFEHSSWRRPFLVIVGATNFGKSGLGRYVLRKVAEKLGLQDYLEVTVEENANLDLSGVDRTQFLKF